MFRAILCPVDFSSTSRLALQAAAAVAARADARLTVLFVDDPLLSEAAKIAFDAKSVAQAALAELRRFAERTVGRTIPRSALSCEIAAGQAGKEIVRAAAKVSADLIVMGTQGLSGPKRLVLGSTAEAVLSTSPVPVLVVPQRAARTVRAPKWLDRPIVAGIDLGNLARDDARRAAALVGRLGGSLVLLHVVRPTPVPPWFRRATGATEKAGPEAARTALRDVASSLAKAKGADKPRVVIGNPAEEIPKIASTLKAGLVVLVLRSGRGLLGPRKGSTTYQVLTSSATPVLALPEQGAVSQGD